MLLYCKYMWIVDALLSVFTLNKHDTYAGDGVCDDNDDNGLRNNNDSAALRGDLIKGCKNLSNFGIISLFWRVIFLLTNLKQISLKVDLHR